MSIVSYKGMRPTDNECVVWLQRNCDTTVSVSLVHCNFLEWDSVWFGRCIPKFLQKLAASNRRVESI